MGGSWKTQVGLQPMLTLHSRYNVSLLSGQEAGLWRDSRNVQETSGQGIPLCRRRVLWSWVGRWRTISGKTGLGIALPRVNPWGSRHRDGTRRVSDTRNEAPGPCSSHLHGPGWPISEECFQAVLGFKDPRQITPAGQSNTSVLKKDN